MVSTRNISRSNANPPRMQDPPGDADSRPPGALETMQANIDEVEALRLTNQRLIAELEQLTRQIQRPREAQQTQEGHNNSLREGQHNLAGEPEDLCSEVQCRISKGGHTRRKILDHRIHCWVRGIVEGFDVFHL